MLKLAPRTTTASQASGPGPAPAALFDVLVEEGSPVETGLLDADGNRLFRIPERHKMGFHQ